MVDEVYYFGYGANRDREMMEAIIGRAPSGYPATISGFDLCIQSWDGIPQKVRSTLKPPWNESFRTYCLVPSTNYTSRPVRGMIWKITPSERKLIDNWEMTGIWYKIFLIQFETGEKRKIQIEVQVVEDQPVSKVIRSPIYKTYINEKQKMIDVATNVRKDYLERNTVN